MKPVLLLLIFLHSNLAISKNVEFKDDKSIKSEILRLNERIDDLENRQSSFSQQIDSQAGMLDTAFDGVSAELSASSNFIGAFGIIIGIFSIGLSIYVSRIEKNVRGLKTENEILLQRNIQIKEDLELLSEKITNDSKGLYKIVRNEESNHLIERLIAVPEDVTNLFFALASRDLEKEQYYKLKEAFIQIKDSRREASEYLGLFFQHFSDLCFQDEVMRNVFMTHLDENFAHAFKNDVLKSVSDFFNAIVNMSISKTINDINMYVLALCKSKFAESEEIYFAINNTLNTKELKFSLYDVISKAPDYLVFRKKFGALIIDYNYDNLTPKEEAIIEEIKNLN